MNKLTLFRTISVIHAIKCNKATTDHLAINSYDKLVELKEQVSDASDQKQLGFVSEGVSRWAGTNPSASENEIKDLFKR